MFARAAKSLSPSSKARRLPFAHRCPLTTISTSPGSPLSSINEDEIKFFSRLSSQWWDEKGEFGLLHKMNPVRIQYIRDKIAEASADELTDTSERMASSSNILKGLDVLDVVCGGGLLSEVKSHLPSAFIPLLTM